MSTKTKKAPSEAFREGYNAVACRPIHAPRNPYDEDKESRLYAAWDEGADEAGIITDYTNGILTESIRSPEPAVDPKAELLPKAIGEIKFAFHLLCNAPKTVKVSDKHEAREALKRALEILQSPRP